MSRNCRRPRKLLQPDRKARETSRDRSAGYGATTAPARPCRSARFQESPRPVISGDAGRVAEWFKAAVLKTAVGASSPWVRIPPLPPKRFISTCFYEFS